MTNFELSTRAVTMHAFCDIVIVAMMVGVMVTAMSMKVAVGICGTVRSRGTMTGMLMVTYRVTVGTGS